MTGDGVKKGKGQGVGKGGKSKGNEVDVVASARHQAGKALSKVCKLVRAFLVLKCTRRITEEKEKEKQKDGGEVADNKGKTLQDCIVDLKSIKEVDHLKLGAAVLESLETAGDKSRFQGEILERYSPAALLSSKICRQFLQHKKLVETIAIWNAKIAEAKAAPPRHHGKNKNSNEPTTATASKAMRIKPRVGLQERTKAVFLDSMEEEEEEEPTAHVGKTDRYNAPIRTNKSARKDGEKQDLSSYMAPADRNKQSRHPPPSNRNNYSSSTNNDSSKRTFSAVEPVQMQRQTRQRLAPPPAPAAAPADASKQHPSWVAKQLLKAKQTSLPPITTASYSMKNKVYFD